MDRQLKMLESTLAALAPRPSTHPPMMTMPAPASAPPTVAAIQLNHLDRIAKLFQDRQGI
jgi:hypothetical protein